ncbi:MAG: hypothetical protein ACK5Y2_09390 [Bdellovibrionales bacterium]
MKTLAALFILSLFQAPLAMAQNLSAREVARLFYQAGCDKMSRGACRGGISTTTYTKNQIRVLPQGLRQELGRRAHDQAQIWGDTILEGDFAADGKTELDEVVVIKSSQKILGYRISYSERAWFTGNCAYRSHIPQTLLSCSEGRILEKAFVATDLSHSQVDENQFAEFVSKD